jgi:polyvinyl alcohol dehydrogenase (cytochrome)
VETLDRAIVAVMRAFSVAAAILGCAALVGACSSSSAPSGGAAASTTTARGSFADSGARDDWPVYGHDLANTRLSGGERGVTAGTVRTLRKRWSIDGLVGVTGTPVVSDGVAYFDDWTGKVRAVSAATGAPRWSTTIGGMFVAAPAVTEDAVYAAAGNTLYKLDRANGAIEWKVVTDDNPYAQISASPVVVDGLVLQGTAGFENIVNHEPYTFRGSIAAYDAATGKQRWKLFTTKGTADDGPGAGVWSTPAVDPARGLLYVGTGQSLAPKTGALADSLLAIDYRTGALKWSTQFTYPDVFSAGHPGGKDADVGASPNLWTSNGRDLVGAGDKGGTFHALDRDTGAVVWETRLTPGSAFGGEIGSAAFVDGTLVATSNIGDPDTNAPTDETKVFGLDPATGRVRWSTRPLPGKVFAPVSAVPGVAFVGTDRGEMDALDTASGKKLWSYTAPAKTAAGPSIVDGRVLWGYGFVLFGAPGPGGVISFSPA